ncbi:MAG: alpha-E domain-containing protein [Burkholderiales bacterium]|nr:alpha-E domain-containing protein [Burkholderiales bacterium]
MDFISVDQSDNLFWLGRYVERVCLTLSYLDKLYDVLLDSDSKAYQEFCRKLNIPDIYRDDVEFLQKYQFDQNNPDSLYSNLSRAYDNGIILRNSISSAALAYIQMSLDKLKQGEKIGAYALLNQQIIDYLLAFWGCLDERVYNAQERSLIKAGRYLERLDMQLRLGAPLPHMEITLGRLERRLRGAKIPFDEGKFLLVSAFIQMGIDDPEQRAKVLELTDQLIKE